METTKFIWMDGQMVPWEQAMIHSLTHTFHYGGGAFEGVRVYETPKGPAIFRLKEHVDRLLYSGRALNMEEKFSFQTLFDAIVETCKVNEVKSAYVRPMLYYGYGKMGLSPIGAPVNAMVACWPWPGLFAGKDTINIKISKYIRLHPRSSVADAKINGHYVNSIMASLEMNQCGKDEALFLDFEGNVAEGPGENLFLVKGGKISTPKLGNILAGITRNSVVELAKELGYDVEERVIRPEELFEADELFFVGTACEVQPIGTVDDRKIGNGQVGQVSNRVKKAYMDIVQGKNPGYEKWLTFIN